MATQCGRTINKPGIEDTGIIQVILGARETAIFGSPPPPTKSTSMGGVQSDLHTLPASSDYGVAQLPTYLVGDYKRRSIDLDYGAPWV